MMGNASLFTVDASGKYVNTPLWLSAWFTDLNLQLGASQLHTKVTYRPIRLAERFLMFSTLWNVKDRPKYAALVSKIRDHWNFNLMEPGSATPMRLAYYGRFGGRRQWTGFIENAEFSYKVTDVVLVYTFRMRLAITPSETVSGIGELISFPYFPTSTDILQFDQAGWYSVGNKGRRRRRSGPRPRI